MLQAEQSKALSAITNAESLMQWQSEIERVHVADPVIDFVLRLVTFSRESGEFANPLSPRASKAIVKAAKSWAWMNGRDHVLPEDVQHIFAAVAEHRLRQSGEDHDLSYVASEKLLAAVDSIAA